MAFDVITPTKLGQAAITTGVTTLYTVPALTRTLLKEFSIANTTGATINVRLFLVPSSGTAGTSNAFLYDVPVLAANALQYISVVSCDNSLTKLSKTNLVVNTSSHPCFNLSQCAYAIYCKNLSCTRSKQLGCRVWILGSVQRN